MSVSNELLARRLAALSPTARALLKERLATRSTNGTRRLAPASGDLATTVKRRTANEPVPLSFGQWRLWFFEQLRPGTNAWNMPIAVRLRGPLDAEALADSLQLLVERHATLRTVFSSVDGQPFPVRLEGVQIELPMVSAETLRGDALTRAVHDFVDAEVARPFDLQCDLMLRARLLRIAPDDHVLVLVIHHIACDGWSKRMLLEELDTVYGALSTDRRPSLPQLPIEYADFAIWQRRYLTGDTLERLTAYWRERLTEATPVLGLPIDHARPRRQRFRGAVEWVTVSAATASPLIAIGREERATPFMTLMAGFKVLLHALSGHEDVLVGSPAAMRTFPEFERLVGLFVNTLVYRTSVAGPPSFRELVRRVRETALGVYEHQDLPFEKLVEAVRPIRDPSRNPLVQVNMRLEGREPRLTLRALEADPIMIDPGIARFDMALELSATDDGFAGYLEYDTALFDRSTAGLIARDFVAVLEDCVSAPDRPLGDLQAVASIRQWVRRKEAQ